MAHFTSILTGPPLWVWPLLLLLIYFGLKATRVRRVPAWPLYMLPLLGLLSVNAVNNLSPKLSIWVLFAILYLVGSGLGFRFQRRIVLEKSGTTVLLSGEWVTLFVLMTVFWMNFLGGTIKAVAPEIFAAAFFHQVFAAVAGLAAGSFLGRAVRVTISPEQMPKGDLGNSSLGSES